MSSHYLGNESLRKRPACLEQLFNSHSFNEWVVLLFLWDPSNFLFTEKIREILSLTIVVALNTKNQYLPFSRNINIFLAPTRCQRLPYRIICLSANRQENGGVSFVVSPRVYDLIIFLSSSFVFTTTVFFSFSCFPADFSDGSRSYRLLFPYNLTTPIMSLYEKCIQLSSINSTPATHSYANSSNPLSFLTTTTLIYYTYKSNLRCRPCFNFVPLSPILNTLVSVALS